MNEAIRNRKSTRNYTGEELKDSDLKKINDYLNDNSNLIGVNGNIVNMHLIKTKGLNSSKIGTYGIIKNAPNFIIVTCKNTKEALLDCGYVVEKLVLLLESMNIGSCWLGGTYNKKQINVPIADDEIIPVIVSIGYKENKMTLKNKLQTTVIKSNTRKDFDTLFFKNNFNEQITDQTTREILESVRLAPSAVNKQPWRVVMDELNTAHFYVQRTPKYSEDKFSSDIQMVDIGIAICHYETEKENVSYEHKNPNIEIISKDIEYVISVKDNK